MFAYSRQAPTLQISVMIFFFFFSGVPCRFVCTLLFAVPKLLTAPLLLDFSVNSLQLVGFCDFPLFLLFSEAKVEHVDGVNGVREFCGTEDCVGL